MQRETRIQLLAGIVLLLCAGASIVLSVRMTAIAGREKMVYTDRAEENDTPAVSLGIAMGAFRGLFVNMLWLRAENMKQDGKYWEAVELAKAITRLQPKFPRVWVFHGWNLAYNISVGTQTRSERWNWVNQGIAILRDQGIPANPNDLLLHKELAWIYLHKIQGYTDDANPYYKRQLAAEWTWVLGQPPTRTGEDRDRAKAVAKYSAWIAAYRDAALTLDDLAKREPSALGVEASFRAIGLGYDTREERKELLGRVEQTRALMTSARRPIFEKQAGPRTKAIDAMVSDPTRAAGLDAFLRYVRRRTIVEDYNMDPDTMVRYVEKYGPIDWRHAAAHSLYWSAKGVEESVERVLNNVKDASGRVVVKGNREDYDFLNTDRVVAQSVQELFRAGELYFDFTAHIAGEYALWQGVPNVHFAQSYGEILDDIRSRSDYDRTIAERVSPLSDAYQNFLIDVVLFYYRRGDLENAEKYQRTLRTFSQRNIYDDERAERFAVPLAQFADRELRDRATSPNVAVNQITAALIGAFSSGLLSRDSALFQSQFNYAKAFHRYFFEHQGRNTSVNRESYRMEQIDRDFGAFAGTLFAQFTTALSREEAEKAFDGAPEGLRLYCYDAMLERWKEQIDLEAEQGGRKFVEIFPEPKGLDAFRTQLKAEMARRAREGAQVEQH